MGIFLGNGGVKTVREIYVGVDGTPRKVKEGYVGVGGVPRLFYKSETPTGEARDQGVSAPRS